MDFKHEIFISYKWGGPRKEWIDKIFVPLLEEALDEVFPSYLKLFKDTDDIVSGATLDLTLQDALAHSKCMICVVSLPYFTKSIWCPTEFSAMLYREEKTEIRKSGNHTGFVFPIIFVNESEVRIQDRSSLYEYDNLRELIYNLSPLELDNEKYNNTNDAFLQSANYISLKNIILKWVRRSIKPAIQNINTWKPEWNSEEYLLNPYHNFKKKYEVVLNPVALPSVR